MRGCVIWGFGYLPNFCLVLDIRVTEVVISNLTQTVFADHPAEMLSHIVRTQELASLIHADVV